MSCVSWNQLEYASVLQEWGREKDLLFHDDDNYDDYDYDYDTCDDVEEENLVFNHDQHNYKDIY